MTKYTVILLRPDYLAEPAYGEDAYLTEVNAESVEEAIQAAREEASVSDSTEDDTIPPEDYLHMFTLIGEPELVADFNDML